MVAVYVGGKRVGELADLEKLLPELIAQHARIEFRNGDGNSIGTFSPHNPPGPGEPIIPWDPTITQEDLDRIAAEPGFTFEEVRKRLGWS